MYNTRANMQSMKLLQLSSPYTRQRAKDSSQFAFPLTRQTEKRKPSTQEEKHLIFGKKSKRNQNKPQVVQIKKQKPHQKKALKVEDFQENNTHQIAARPASSFKKEQAIKKAQTIQLENVGDVTKKGNQSNCTTVLLKSYKYVKTIEELVGKKGAKLTVGGCIVDIPAGALKTEDEVAPLLNCEPDGQKFEKPVTIQLQTCYVAKPSDKIKIKNSEDRKVWDIIKEVDHSDEDYITFKTDHFSYFQAFQEASKKKASMQFVSFTTHVDKCESRLRVKQKQENFNTVSRLIGPEGGKLEVNGCSLVIPQGALSADVLISMTPYVKKNGVTPYVKCGPAGITFQKKVTITLPLLKLESKSLTVKFCNEGSTWQTLKKRPKIMDGKISFQTNHFTWFGAEGDVNTKKKLVKFGARKPFIQTENSLLLISLVRDKLDIVEDSDVFRCCTLAHEDQFEIRRRDDPIAIRVSSDASTFQSQQKNLFSCDKSIFHYRISCTNQGLVDYHVMSSNGLKTNGHFFIPELERQTVNMQVLGLVDITRRITDSQWERFADFILNHDDTAMDDSTTENIHAELYRQHILSLWQTREGNDADRLRRLVDDYLQGNQLFPAI